MLLFVCVYTLVGIYYWILLTDGRLLLDRDYPQRIQTDWSGLRGNIDSVYTDFSGRTFFFKVNTACIVLYPSLATEFDFMIILALAVQNICVY